VNLSDVARYFKKSADQGYAPTQYLYGLFLQHGSGVEMNQSAAVLFFKLSADQGYVQAQYHLAVLLLEKEPSESDSRPIAELLQQAAEAGCVAAQLRYGGLLRVKRLICGDGRNRLRIKLQQKVRFGMRNAFLPAMELK
jgi:TPR repeat protein